MSFLWYSMGWASSGAISTASLIFQIRAKTATALHLYARGVATAIRRGEVDRIIAEALRDGEIDEAELAEIIVAHRQHLAARHAEVGAVITLHRRVKA